MILLTLSFTLPFRYQRLYNTVLYSVLINKDDEKITLLLAKYTASENERYPTDHGIGSKTTSSKAQVEKGNQFGKSIGINIKDALDDMPKTVRSVLEWIRDTKGV